MISGGLIRVENYCKVISRQSAADAFSSDLAHPYLLTALICCVNALPGFIQGSLSKFKDFSRTSKDFPTVFQGLKYMKKYRFKC